MQWVTLAENDIRDEHALKTNRDAIAFNPATLFPASYGLSVSKYTANMTAYVVDGEILNNLFDGISKPIGSLVRLPNQPGSAIDNHYMSSVIAALKQYEFSKLINNLPYKPTDNTLFTPKPCQSL